jgi:hypothetical protein
MALNEGVPSGSGRPVGGPARSGDLVDLLAHGELVERTKELGEATLQELKGWYHGDTDLFFQDIKELMKLYKERHLKCTDYRKQSRDAKDDLAKLQDQFQSYKERIAEEQEIATRNKTMLDRLLAEAPSREQTPASHQSGTPGPSSSFRIAKLPDPVLFSGEDRTMFDDWLIQIKNKLRGNRDFYPTEDMKILYVSSRLSGSALALVTPRLDEDCQTAYHTVSELYIHLKELYSDPNKASNARRELHSLRMSPSQLFQEFYAAFLRLATESGLRPEDYKYEINERLTWTLQAGVATYYNNPSITATAFAQFCTTEDQQNRAREVKQRRAERNKAKYSGAPVMATTTRTFRPTNQIAERMPAPEVAKATGTPIVTTHPDKGTKVLSTVKCFNCNKFGHYASSCSLPHTNKTRIALAHLEQGLASDGEFSDSVADSEN